MNDASKICIIIPYFGTWPEWIEYFFLSCRYNQNLDWLIFTDCAPREIDTDNIIFINTSLDTINELASEKLGIQLNIKHPYKLCDIKPAYGLIFSDYIKNYDFWGYGDLDLVYGNIRYFITDEILSEFDIISNHPDFITGHFCILRNNPFIIELYKHSNYYKTAFLRKKYIGFDEQISHIKINTNPRSILFYRRINIFIHLFLVNLKGFIKRLNLVRIKRGKKSLGSGKLKDYSSIVKYFNNEGRIRVYYKKTFQSDLMLKKEGIRNWKVEWKEGHLFNQNDKKEILYFHFILSKFKKSFEVQPLIPGNNSFMITKSGIYNSDK